jgi:GT2 family glycosyltransferase
LRHSIVTPTYNRPDRLAQFLESLTSLEYPRGEFEVVLVDDGSDVPAEQVARSYAETLQIRFFRQNHGGVAKARHGGAYAARGRYLVFTDDDCRPDPGWLRAIDGVLEKYPDAAVGGLTVNALTGNAWSTASQAIIHYLYDAFNRDWTEAVFFTGNNCAFPREGYFAVGGLDTSWPMCGEDRDLCDRWTASGRRLVYTPEAVVKHHHTLDAERFWRQHYNYGRGARRFRHLSARRRGQPARVERLGFYRGLIASAWQYRQEQPGWLIALMMLQAQAANAAGYFDEMVSPLKDAPQWTVETTLCA